MLKNVPYNGWGPDYCIPYALVWCKMAFFKRVWHKLKVLPHLNPSRFKEPLIRAFKWRIVWEYTKSEFGDKIGQSWKFKKSPFFKVNLKVLIWPIVHPKPLEVYTHKRCHLKAVISGSLDLKGLRCGSTFTLYHALLKKAILHHKRS